MNFETVSALPTVAARYHDGGKYGSFLKALRAQTEGWLRIPFSEMPHLQSNENRRIALRQVTVRFHIPVDTCTDEQYIYVRRKDLRSSSPLPASDRY